MKKKILPIVLFCISIFMVVLAVLLLCAYEYLDRELVNVGKDTEDMYEAIGVVFSRASIGFSRYIFVGLTCVLGLAFSVSSIVTVANKVMKGFSIALTVIHGAGILSFWGPLFYILII